MQTVANPSIPNSWFTCDIKVGSLTLHLDEDNWLKALMQEDDYNMITQIFDKLAAGQDGKNVDKRGDPHTRINIGVKFVEKLLARVSE